MPDVKKLKGLPFDLSLGLRFQAIAPPLVIVLVRRYGFPEAVAEDAVSKVFERLAELIEEGVRLPLLEVGREHEFYNYVLRAGLHGCLDFYRAHKKEVSDSEDVLMRLAEPGSVEEAFEWELERSRLAEAVARLPESYRPLFQLWMDEGLSIADIAKALKRNPGSIYVQIDRGLAKLRAILSEKS